MYGFAYLIISPALGTAPLNARVTTPISVECTATVGLFLESEQERQVAL